MNKVLQYVQFDCTQWLTDSLTHSLCEQTKAKAKLEDCMLQRGVSIISLHLEVQWTSENKSETRKHFSTSRGRVLVLRQKDLPKVLYVDCIIFYTN